MLSVSHVAGESGEPSGALEEQSEECLVGYVGFKISGLFGTLG